MKYCTVDNTDIKEKQPCIVFEKDAAIPYDCNVLMILQAQGKTHEDCEHYKEAEKDVFEQVTEIDCESRFSMVLVSYNFDNKCWSACLRNACGGFESNIREKNAEDACRELLRLWNEWQKRNKA
jgi:hypothetical protein